MEELEEWEELEGMEELEEGFCDAAIITRTPIRTQMIIRSTATPRRSSFVKKK